MERSGRESVLSDAFLKNARKLDDEALGFTTFDFHEVCRGMKFENVAILVDALQHQLKDMR